MRCPHCHKVIHNQETLARGRELESWLRQGREQQRRSVTDDSPPEIQELHKRVCDRTATNEEANRLWDWLNGR